MRKLLLGLFFCISSVQVFSQIIGKVIDDKGVPVASATVKTKDFGSVVTSENGEFRIANARAGSYEITISSVGFETLQKLVESGGEVQTFQLKSLNLFLKPVEITAIRAGERAPFTKTNISRKEIEKANLGQDLPFLLNQTPSVVVSSDAGNGIGYTGIRIRGTDATRINMTINGIPYNDAESQGLFFVNLPDLASSVNSIQIQRGVGTSSNGAGAFGATMNFSTNEVNTNPYAEFNNSYGSFNTWKNTFRAGTGLLNDHFTVDARLSRITSDGFIERASTDLSSFYVSAAYLTEKTAVRFNILSGKEKTYQAWNGIPESDLENNRTKNYAGLERPGSPYENETDNYQQDHYQFFVNHQLNSALTFNTALFLTRGRGYYEQYKAGENYSSYNLPDFIMNQDTVSETDLIRQLWLDNYYYGQVFSLQYKDQRSEITLGGGWNRYEGDHFGEITWASAGVPDGYRWYDLPATKSDINSYLKYQYKINSKLEVFGDLQLRFVDYELNGFRYNPDLNISNRYHFFNPKVGINYMHDNNQFYFSYSQANKEPNRDDFEAGLEQQPKAEQLHDLELGWEFRKPRFNFGSTIYYMGYKDQLVLTGQINDVGAYARTNIENSFRMGIELQAGANFSSWMNLAGNLTFSRNRILNFTEYFDDYDLNGQKFINHGNTDISFSPAITGALTLNLRPAKNFEISLPAKYVSRQYLDNTSDISRSLDPFYVQDLRLSYGINNKLAKNITLMVQVNNLFNKKYEPNGYTFSYVYGGSMVTENFYFPMAGINAMMGVNIRL